MALASERLNRLLGRKSEANAIPGDGAVYPGKVCEQFDPNCTRTQEKTSPHELSHPQASGDQTGDVPEDSGDEDYFREYYADTSDMYYAEHTSMISTEELATTCSFVWM
jgi:hypothetical protein